MHYPQCPRALLPVSYLQFHGITYPLVLVFSYLCSENLKVLNSSNSSVSNLGYIQMSLKDPLLSVSLFCHLASIILCALIVSETLTLYKSFTYLLTYLQIFTMRNIIEQSQEHQQDLIITFINFKKAFHGVQAIIVENSDILRHF